MLGVEASYVSSRAAAALARAAPKLMDVDEHGRVLSWEEREKEQDGNWDIPYTSARW